MSVLAFFSVGPLEIALLAIIALLVLGPRRLPEAARSLGRGMREMRQALQGGGEEGQHAHAEEEREGEEGAEADGGDEPHPGELSPPYARP